MTEAPESVFFNFFSCQHYSPSGPRKAKQRYICRNEQRPETFLLASPLVVFRGVVLYSLSVGTTTPLKTTAGGGYKYKETTCS